jgi:hypothetical protein
LFELAYPLASSTHHLGVSQYYSTLSLPAQVMNDDIQHSSHGAEREDTWFEKKFGRLTNLQILIIISVLFTLFFVAEIVGALVSE